MQGLTADTFGALKASHAGDSHIFWLHGTAQFSPCIDAHGHCLSDPEWRRADKFRYGTDRQHFLIRRIILRLLLARLMDLEPADIVYAISPGGKMALCPSTHPKACWHFNTGHSGTCAVIALSRHGEIGVDIERRDGRPGLVHIARDNFTEAERNWLGHPADEPGFTEKFYRLWTAKEAILKYLGTGLGLRPCDIDVSVDGDQLHGVRADIPCAHLASPGWPPVLYPFVSTENATNRNCTGMTYGGCLAMAGKTYIHHFEISDDAAFAAWYLVQ